MASKKRTGAERAFMNWALLQIVTAGNHPLKFLVDPSTLQWHSRLGSRRKDATKNEHFPAVQAGHLTTFSALDDEKNERLALQDADDNQEQNYTIEARRLGMIVILEAVDIGAVPVVKGSARLWGSLDLLKPKGSVAAAASHQGWARV